jgi:hypothetical protein
VNNYFEQAQDIGKYVEFTAIKDYGYFGKHHDAHS